MIHILFVCTGNTCRSPLAEAILKNKNLPNVAVKSAGIFAANGMNASQHAQTVLKEHHINYEHQSTLLTANEVNWANFILTMTNGHKHTIINNFPEAKGKTYTLKQFAAEETGDIIDPFGGTLDDYRLTFIDIQKNVEKLISKLEQIEGDENGEKKKV